jgi:hypothetical protein
MAASLYHDRVIPLSTPRVSKRSVHVGMVFSFIALILLMEVSKKRITIVSATKKANMKRQRMLARLAAVAILACVGLFAQSASGGQHACGEARLAQDDSIRALRIKVPKHALTDLRRLAAIRWPEKETVNDRSVHQAG